MADLLSVADAQAIVLEHTQPLSPETVPLTSAMLGLVLAEDIVSDIDMPPFDKAMMDGYAVRSADVAGGHGTLTVIEEVTAGKMPERALLPGQATRIMTGAPIPSGADAVVQVERTRLLDQSRVQIDDRPAKPGLNILRRGQEMRSGDTVLSAGTQLRPQEFGILATVGRTFAQVYPPPHVAILSTGDEIVEAHQTPGPGQIRNGNGPMLLAQCARAGAVRRCLGNARDARDELLALIGEGLKSHVLVLSGGVSAGKLDLVPSVLQELGVQAHFHRVAMKPGKPILFGTRAVAIEDGATHGWREGEAPAEPNTTGGSAGASPSRQLATLVFGLPGNPVSSYVCFELFVRPALRKLRNLPEPGPRMVQAKMAVDFSYRTDRPTYHPAWLEAAATGWQVRPVPWFGSPDLRGLAAANAFVLFAPDEHHYQTGQDCTVLCVEERD